MYYNKELCDVWVHLNATISGVHQAGHLLYIFLLYVT